MNHSEFEYFLNAVLYCLWISENKREEKIQKMLDVILSPIPKYLFTREYRKKFYERKKRERKSINQFYRDKKTGFNIRLVIYWFGYIYSCYPGFFSFILVALGVKFFGDISYFVTLLLFAIPVALGYIPAYKAVFTNDRYLKYFKKFEKEDEAWHKKWKRRTTLFIIGGIMAFVLGIAAMFAILILIPEP